MVVGLVAAAGVALGSVLPWVSVTAGFVGSVGINGADDDGMITLILAAGALLFCVPRVHVGAALCFVAAGAVAVYDAVNINREFVGITGGAAQASIGYGLWVVIAAAAVGLIATAARGPSGN
jgi:hypothetical protein